MKIRQIVLKSMSLMHYTRPGIEPRPLQFCHRNQSSNHCCAIIMYFLFLRLTVEDNEEQNDKKIAGKNRWSLPLSFYHGVRRERSNISQTGTEGFWVITRPKRTNDSQTGLWLEQRGGTHARSRERNPLSICSQVSLGKKKKKKNLSAICGTRSGSHLSWHHGSGI